MQLSLQLSKLQGTRSYFDGNMGRVGVKSDTVTGRYYALHLTLKLARQAKVPYWYHFSTPKLAQMQLLLQFW